MIPEFPQFKKLEFSDKADVESITRTYPPYSDFNFTSMWCWDTRGETRLSLHCGNLVVKFLNYMTTQPFYSCMGQSSIDRTIEAVLQLSKKEGIDAVLKLIPEEMAKAAGRFSVKEDPDNFDYVYELTSLYELPGPNFQRKRNTIKNFSKSYPDARVIPIDMSTSDTQACMLGVVDSWHENKVAGSKDNNYENEVAAMRRLLSVASETSGLVAFGCFDRDKMIGFSINELLGREYAINHFIKADITYRGIFSYIMKESAGLLLAQGARRLNFEQDLGIPGLRDSKRMLYPACFLKKYLIEP